MRADKNCFRRDQANLDSRLRGDDYRKLELELCAN